MTGSAFGSGLDDFAPEERTNILVYDKANRSVVHITTKATQRELLFNNPMRLYWPEQS